MNPISRRTFFGAAAAAAAAPLASATTIKAATPSFFDLLRIPDYAAVYTESSTSATPLTRNASLWQASGIELRTEASSNDLAISVAAPTTPLTRIHLRWSLTVAPDLLYLGDAWERSYGDLAFRTMVPERVLPWYFAAHDPAANSTHTYGACTGPSAFCFWQVDPARRLALARCKQRGLRRSPRPARTPRRHHRLPPRPRRRTSDRSHRRFLPPDVPKAAAA